MSEKEIEIEIDGRPLKAIPSQTVMQVADAAGIYIPRFCYHKHLSIAANCRMCLVEVEKAPKTLPACATPVMPGMKVFTTSTKTRLSQRAVMEFLLINHPLDCPICDQGGECELQDLAMGYGRSHSRYEESKRAVPDLALGPLIATEMTRCIHCTRCVRFGEEIAGMAELGVTYRGEHNEISTYVQHSIRSEVSGNMIDLCPVGALTAKPSRFTLRPWELDQAVSISPHDCLGSHLAIHTLRGTVMRVAACESHINETWLADRDRFSYTALDHADRLKEPMIKIDGEWQIVDWQTALISAANKIKESIAQFGAEKFGSLATPQATVEELYLLQKLTRGLKSPHIDHRLREQDVRDQENLGAFPGCQLSLSALEQCDAIILIGTHITKEQPLAGLRIRKATLKKAAVIAINPIDYEFHFPVKAKRIIAPHLYIQELAHLLHALHTEDHTSSLVAALSEKKQICLVVGASVMHHPEASLLRTLISNIALKLGAAINFMTDGPNTAGGWLAGAVPHREAGGYPIHHVGLSAYEMLSKPRKAYLLLNVEPDYDCVNAQLATVALQQAHSVVALSIYHNAVLHQHAHVILPMTPFTETAGTFINAMGEWQSFVGMAKPYYAARPAWKILRALANFLDLPDFEYEESNTIKAELKTLIQRTSVLTAKTITHDKVAVETDTALNNSVLSRIGDIPIYAIDGLTRRAYALQAAQEVMLGDLTAIYLHPHTAQQLALSEGQVVTVKQLHSERVRLPVKYDVRIAEQAAYVAGGLAGTTTLGDLFGPIEIQKV